MGLLWVVFFALSLLHSLTWAFDIDQAFFHCSPFACSSSTTPQSRPPLLFTQYLYWSHGFAVYHRLPAYYSDLPIDLTLLLLCSTLHFSVLLSAFLLQPPTIATSVSCAPLQTAPPLHLRTPLQRHCHPAPSLLSQHHACALRRRRCSDRRPHRQSSTWNLTRHDQTLNRRHQLANQRPANETQTHFGYCASSLCAIVSFIAFVLLRPTKSHTSHVLLSRVASRIILYHPVASFIADSTGPFPLHHHAQLPPPAQLGTNPA